MRLLLSTHEGLTEAVEIELARFDAKIIESGRSFVICDTENPEQILLRMQTVLEVIELKGQFTFTDYDDISVKFSSQPGFESPGPFRIRCTRVGEHDFRSPDVMNSVDHRRISAGKGPETIIRFYIEDDRCFYGVDLAGIELSKRDYRIFRHKASVKGTAAAALAALCKVKDGDVIVDPFCKDGTVAIETSFWLGRSTVRRFMWEEIWLSKTVRIPAFDSTTGQAITAIDSSNHNLSYARKNIQIAGLKDTIKLVREEVEWLTTRFDKVDLMLTLAPAVSQRSDEKLVRRLYDELFEAADELDSRIGAIVTCADIFAEEAQKKGFELQKRVDFSTGQQEHSIIILKK